MSVLIYKNNVKLCVVILLYLRISFHNYLSNNILLFFIDVSFFNSSFSKYNNP